jgi:hypothetical protein
MAADRFKVTRTGGIISIALEVEEYKKLLDDLEELDCIRAFDAAEKSGETPVPFESAIQEIERSRN